MSVDRALLDDLFANDTLGSPDNAVGFVLWRAVHRYQRAIDRALAPLELTHLQFTTLALAAWMGRAGTPVSQAELARFGDIHPMQVSLMFKALEAKAMVSRPRSISDTRAKHIEITTAGVDALRRAMPIAIEVQQRLFGEAGRPGGALLVALLRLEGTARLMRKLVRAVGIEPTLCRQNRILSPARLPVPPRPRRDGPYSGHRGARQGGDGRDPRGTPSSN